MNKTFEKIYSENNAILDKDMVLKENTALFEKVYAEAEMLNEMNPKLRALLAAGLIGTAGLGATSCSTPNDDYEEPTAIEQPTTPETPGSTTETPAEPETPTETEDTKETAALSGFKALGVEDYAENLARAKPLGVHNKILGDGNSWDNLIYENGFIPAKFKIDTKELVNSAGNILAGSYTIYADPSAKIAFFVPVEMENAFSNAISDYNKVHIE